MHVPLWYSILIPNGTLMSARVVRVRTIRTMVRTRVRTRVPWYTVYHGTDGTYSSTMVHVYVHVYVLVIVVEIRAADRHRCRVGTSTVVYRDVFYADNAHVVLQLHLSACISSRF